MAKKQTKPVFTQEFRETAIKLAVQGNNSIAEVAVELGLPKWKLYGWVQTWKKKTGQSAAVSIPAADEELKRLQKRNKELEQEVEILKKAAAYFAKTLL